MICFHDKNPYQNVLNSRLSHVSRLAYRSADEPGPRPVLFRSQGDIKATLSLTYATKWQVFNSNLHDSVINAHATT